MRSGNDPIHESETARLQREVDIYTHKFENEKRKLQILQDQIKQVDNELKEKNANIAKIKPEPIAWWDKVKPNSLGDKIDSIRLDSQQHAIKNEQLSLN